MRTDPTHSIPLTDTEPALAEAQNQTHDHMGRRHAATVAEAFRQDLPWIAGMVGLLVFLVGALAGAWGR